MKSSLSSKGRSAGYARDRMKTLLVSERIGCSPQMMKMLRNDLIRTVKKYITVDEKNICISVTQEPLIFHADIPVRSDKE